MRIVFLGTPAVAVTALRRVTEAGHEVPLVVTRADRPASRSARPLPPPVKVAATELGLTVAQSTRVRSPAFVEQLARQQPDVLVVVAYGRILTRAVLDVATAGAINLHFSLLPGYRGAAPVQWALARGEAATGVSTMQIDEGLDEGDVLLQQEIAIEPGEHAPALQARLAEIGADLLVQTLERLRAGTLEPRRQDPARATFAPRLKPADGAVDPAALSAGEIAGRVRGFDPWPGVWLGRDGKRLRLIEAEDSGRTDRAAEPGRVLALEGRALMVACANGTLLGVTSVQPEGRRAMSSRDAVNGRQLAPGDLLEPIRSVA